MPDDRSFLQPSWCTFAANAWCMFAANPRCTFAANFWCIIAREVTTSPKLVDRGLSYDPGGNVTSVIDAVNQETIGYSYDHLDRLLSASAPAGESFTYDTIGNITAKNGVGYSYGDTNHKHAVTAHNGKNYAYDANGNMITRDTQAIAYDPLNRPVRVDVGGATVCRFAYDGDGVRQKRVDANGTIHYLGPYERNVGNGQSTTEVITKYYYASFGALRRLVTFRKGKEREGRRPGTGRDPDP